MLTEYENSTVKRLPKGFPMTFTVSRNSRVSLPFPYRLDSAWKIVQFKIARARVKVGSGRKYLDAQSLTCFSSRV